ncbi:hypothetical protein EPUS_00599 [Endocarpon pusillum Z07020]|uniref:Monooxygenase n=1 Tax=Endocarpon pusillum (strain Z07020 / HMAS-L-300199) TaxID=1263415 RepID=U1HMR8_ENDPU|nr:uncharacterized protein EPUS_00599 [Endocarpon pusillum Z07020]ERF71610.1 hypothetical protein EPUS_00599 [Endocarpon pusillum Z07020]
MLAEDKYATHSESSARCTCDVPSHNYTYSFEPKHDWTNVYASSAEIKTYFADFAQEYGLHKFIKLSHRMQMARWSEKDGQWHVQVDNLATGETIQNSCHILIHACGYLNKPSWPEIPGIDDYRGKKLHSADYDETISLQGKEVILIGNGSSAAQILPTIQPVVKHVKIFIRSPLWLLPDISSDQRPFTPEEIEKFVQNPNATIKLRKLNETTMNSIFSVYLRDSVLQAQSRELLQSQMKKILNNEYLEEKLIPSFAVGCKRVVPSGFRYLKALLKENVTIVHGAVGSFVETGCTSEDDTVHPSEIIICATGFDTSYIPRYPIIGPNNRNMQEEWASSLDSYMGVAASEFPNMFMFLGPYSPVSNGPTLVAIANVTNLPIPETQADYILSFIDRYQTEPIHSLAPKAAAVDEFKAHVATFMGRAVWSDACRSSHNNHTVNGRVPTTWPGSTLHYLEAMREQRADDWKIVYKGNRFSWLGNGISQTEWDPTSDLAYYIRDRDDGPWGSRWRKTAERSRSGTQPRRELHRQLKLAAKNGAEKNMEDGRKKTDESEQNGTIHHRETGRDGHSWPHRVLAEDA